MAGSSLHCSLEGEKTLYNKIDFRLLCIVERRPSIKRSRMHYLEEICIKFFRKKKEWGLLDKFKILIIEDEERLRNELCDYLQHYGYEVDAVTNFRDVRSYIKVSNPHLILLDINLPYLDGYTLNREIRKFSDIPIIVVTSRDNEIDELMSMNLGADDFVTKPYNLQILIARMEKLLKRVYVNHISNILVYRN